MATAMALLGVLQSAALQVYADPLGRFQFSYPVSWGATSAGTNNGFLDRMAAVRFSAFPARFTGEAVLTRGFPLIDLQAVGGLYDGLTLEIFPDSLRRAVIGVLPRLTAATFCEALGRRIHLDPDRPAFASLTTAQRDAIRRADVMRNENLRVVDCRVNGQTVTFDKERSFRDGDPVQHVYGAIRFLPEPFLTFQLVAGGAAPDRATLTAIAAVVESFGLK